MMCKALSLSAGAGRFLATQLSPKDRETLLARMCGNDRALRTEAESLLGAFDNAAAFLANPTAGGEAGSSYTAPFAEGPGMKVGPYKLLQRIGEGGFGAVYMAEQSEPVRRKVALKIIKLGMDTKQVIARFEAERQALAMMDHPNIAKVLDAGATESGRPYFVMELVKGVPITDYCDTEKLSTNDRLELVTSVCNAVQHAHQKGVIHRDIKPSNVMVTLADGRPIPKVIDFGIAKATAGALTDKTLFTEFRQLIGTPAYMSPEQAEMSGVDIDTRSDIYSLGVLLYELLTGTTPFDPERLRSAAFGELQRIIREEDPDKPSTRVRSLPSEPGDVGSGAGTIPNELQAHAPGQSPPHEQPIARAQGSSAFSALVPRTPLPAPSSAIDIVRYRRTDSHSLSKQLRGDLDWMMLQAQGRLEEAEPFLRESLEGRRRALGEAHQETLWAKNRMIILLREMYELDGDVSKLEEADEIGAKAVRDGRRVVAYRRPGVEWLLVNHANVLTALGQFKRSEDQLREAKAVSEDTTLPVANLFGLNVLKRSLAKAFVDLYDAWDAAEPGSGYDGLAAEWRTRLEAFEPPESDGNDGG